VDGSGAATKQGNDQGINSVPHREADGTGRQTQKKGRGLNVKGEKGTCLGVSETRADTAAGKNNTIEGGVKRKEKRENKKGLQSIR